jgi:putative endonuclease
MAGSTQRRARGKVNYLSGDAAEQQVAQHYARKGMPIVHRRWRGHAGEIDLVARNGSGFVFVEVKKSNCHARAASSLSAAQMSRIYRAAEQFLGTQRLGLLTEARFDVALVNGAGGVQLIENAFGQG